MSKLLKLEPVFSAATVQAVLALTISFGFHLSAAVTGSIEAVAAAILALIAAAAVDKVTVTTWTGLFLAAGTLLIALKVPHITSGEVSAANVVVGLIFAQFVRSQVTPMATVNAAKKQPTPAPSS